MNALTSDLEHLAELARHEELADRGELLASLGVLLICREEQLADQQREHSVELTLDLLNESSLDDQIALAELIATSSHAPRQVVTALAKTHIAAAAIVLEQSPVLTQHDLIEIARTTGPDHCKAMAARQGLSPKVCDAIISNGDEDTLKTLINNHTAQISDGDIARLVAIAKRFPVLALPILQRPNLARRYAEEIADCSSKTVQQLVARMVPSTLPDPSARQSARLIPPGPSGAQSDADQRVKTLKASGRLRTAILVKALHQKDEKLFIAAFAEFLSIASSFIAKLFKSHSASAMALAYRALGGSQQQFETVLVLYRSMNNLPTTLSAQDRAEIERIFFAVSQDGAKRALSSLLTA